MRTRLEAAWPYALVIATTLWTFRATLDGTGHLPYDAELYHFPLMRAVADAWQGGVLPDWDPYTYGGMPLLANAQSAWAYPPHLLATLLASLTGGVLTQATVQWLSALHLAALGCGTTWLARGRGIERGGAAFAGVFVVLTGQVLSQVQHLGMTETIAWVPFALVAVDRLAAGAGPRWIVLLAACVAGIVTAGFLPLATPALLLVALWAVARPAPLVAARRAALGIVAGLALAAVVLLPILALLSVYPPLDPHGALPAGGLLTAVLPQAFGHWLPDLTGFDGPGTVTATYSYLGIGALLVAPAALLALRTGGRRELALAAGFLLAAFGTVAAELASVMQALPSGVSLWRPELFAYVAMVPLALVFGRGLETASRSRAALGAGVALTAIVLVLRAIPVTGPIEAWENTAVIAAVAAAALILAARAGSAAPQRRALLVGAAAVLFAVELSAHASPRYWAVASGPASAADARGTSDGATVVDDLRTRLRTGERVFTDLMNVQPEWVGYGPVWRLRQVNGFHPQVSEALIEGVQALPGDWRGQKRTFPLDPGQRPLMNALAVRFAVVNPAQDPLAGERGFRRVLDTPAYRAYEVLGRPATASVVAERCAKSRPQDPTSCAGEPAKVTLTGRSSRSYAIAPAAAGSVLLPSEVHYPGWHATADRGTATVERVGYLAAVRVPAGATRIELRYRPPGLLVGAVISAIAAAALLALLWRGRRRDEPAADAPATEPQSA